MERLSEASMVVVVFRVASMAAEADSIGNLID